MQRPTQRFRNARRLISGAFLVGLLVATPATVVIGQDAPASGPPADAERAVVLRVTDGDTIRVDRGSGTSERLRYIGIDTPETVKPGSPVEPWGPEASAANAALVEDQVVMLERDVSDTDRYDRLLRYVWLEADDGWVMVNGELVALGLARVRAYEPDTRHHAWLQELEREARAAGVGLHGPANGDAEDGAADDSGLIEDLLDFIFG